VKFISGTHYEGDALIFKEKSAFYWFV
jgi:hypothetical protein